jgi:hypothetical protein
MKKAIKKSERNSPIKKSIRLRKQKVEAPDKDCYTLPNGECIADCDLHAPLAQ